MDYQERLEIEKLINEKMNPGTLGLVLAILICWVVILTFIVVFVCRWPRSGMAHFNAG